MKNIGFDSTVRIVRTFLLVIFYYMFSISLTFYNKWMIKHFHFPLSTSVVHYTVVFLLAAFIRKLWEFCYEKKRIILGWEDYLKRVFPTATASSLDIGLSNWSFMYITVSLYTMSKSSSIIFILFFSLIFKLEKLNVSVIGVVLLIALGLFLFTYKSTQFNLQGFTIMIIDRPSKDKVAKYAKTRGSDLYLVAPTA